MEQCVPIEIEKGGGARRSSRPPYSRHPGVPYSRFGSSDDPLEGITASSSRVTIFRSSPLFVSATSVRRYS